MGLTFYCLFWVWTQACDSNYACPSVFWWMGPYV